MPLKKWKPRKDATARELILRCSIGRTRKLYGFLRDYRHVIFDDDFQSELASMYRRTGAGKQPVTPALLAIVTLLQAYERASDAETIERTVVDLRWQIVLDRLGNTKPPFSQATLRDFRERLSRTDMHTRLIDRVARIAEEHQAYDKQKVLGLRAGITTWKNECVSVEKGVSAPM